MDTILGFDMAQFAVVFGLLFLNNILMYLVATRHVSSVMKAQRVEHTFFTKMANRYERSLRAVIHAFKDEAEGLPMPGFECQNCNTSAACDSWCVHAVNAAFDCPQSHTNGGKCYILGEHVH